MSAATISLGEVRAEHMVDVANRLPSGADAPHEVAVSRATRFA